MSTAKRKRIPKAEPLVAVDEFPDTELDEQDLENFDPDDELEGDEPDFAVEDGEVDDSELENAELEDPDPDEQPDAPVETGPDALDTYLANVHDTPVVQTAPHPSKREPRGDDEFKVLWPDYAGHPLAKLAAKFRNAGVPVPENMSRKELVAAGFNVSDAVHGGYLIPLSEDCPEQPYLTPEEFAQTFQDKNEKDAARRLEAVLGFVRWPQGDPLHHRIPMPLRPDYVRALVGGVSLTPACLSVLLTEIDRVHTATQELAFGLLDRDVALFRGKAALPAVAKLTPMVRDDWDSGTIQLFLNLLEAIPAPPSLPLLQALRHLQHTASPELRDHAVKLEWVLFTEPGL